MPLQKVVNGVLRDMTQAEEDAFHAASAATLPQDVLAFAQQVGAQFISGYPDIETKAWPKKQLEAAAILAGETDPAKYPVIAAEIALSGLTASEAATVIATRAGAFEAISGILSGFRQKALADIEAAETNADKIAAFSAAKAAMMQALAPYL